MSCYAPSPSPQLRGSDRIHLKSLGRDGVSIDRETIDLRYVEQLIDPEQSAALGWCMVYAQKHLLDGTRPLRQIVAELMRHMDAHGLAALCDSRAGVPFLARPRAQEIFACLDRYRSLRMF